MCSLAAIILLLPLAVLGDFVPTAPSPGDSFREGFPCTISWEEDKGGVWNNVTIDLMSGSNTNMTFVTRVVSLDGTDPSRTQYSWTCPEVEPHSAIYFYQFVNGDDRTNSKWTSRFTIGSPDGSSEVPEYSTQPNGDPIPWGTGHIVSRTSTDRGVEQTQHLANGKNGTDEHSMPSVGQSAEDVEGAEDSSTSVGPSHNIAQGPQDSTEHTEGKSIEISHPGSTKGNMVENDEDHDVESTSTAVVGDDANNSGAPSPTQSMEHVGHEYRGTASTPTNTVVDTPQGEATLNDATVDNNSTTSSYSTPVTHTQPTKISHPIESGNSDPENTYSPTPGVPPPRKVHVAPPASSSGPSLCQCSAPSSSRIDGMNLSSGGMRGVRLETRLMMLCSLLPVVILHIL